VYILKNALKNIRRNKGRNILVGLILTTIIAATVVGLVINNTASAVIIDYRFRFGSQVSIGLDVEVLRTRYDIPPDVFISPIAHISPERALTFAQSQYLMRYVMTASKIAGNNDLTAVADANIPRPTFRVGLDGERIDIDTDEIEQMIMPQFRVMGNMWSEFETGERFLLEGQMPEFAGEALISQELAEINRLTVGDKITVLSTTMVVLEDEPVSTKLTVSGIYLDLTETESQQGGFADPFLNRRNEILTTADTFIKSIEQDPRILNVIYLQITYYLRAPAYLPYFEAEIREKGLDAAMFVTTDEAAFNTIVEPVEGLRSIIFPFVIVVLGLGAIILILLSTIAIRERKYEIGVLRAMGMKKGKVVRGLLYEMGIVTVICLVLGLAVGNIAAQPVADNLLQQQVEIAENTAPAQIRPQAGTMEAAMEVAVRDLMGPMNPPEAEPLSEISVRLSAPAMLQIAAVAILLAFAASAIGFVNIMKYEPIKILMERD